MASNKEKIRMKYSGGCEEGRDQRSRAGSLEFYYTKKHLAPFIRSDSHVIEIGCGTGYYGMYFAPFCARYRGIEMEKMAEAHGFEVVKNCGLDFMVMMGAIEQMTDEQFQYYLELADRMAESRFCTGLSNHALLICRKKEE